MYRKKIYTTCIIVLQIHILRQLIQYYNHYYRPINFYLKTVDNTNIIYIDKIKIEINIY
jgi:hypothetical protein